MEVKTFIKKIIGIFITLSIIVGYASENAGLSSHPGIVILIYCIFAWIYWTKKIPWETVIFIIATIFVFGILRDVFFNHPEGMREKEKVEIILQKNGNLYQKNKKTGKKTQIANNIQKFYLGRNIIAQNSTQIVSISYDGKEIQRIKKDAVLKGYHDNVVYFTDFKQEQKGQAKSKLHKMNLNKLEQE